MLKKVLTWIRSHPWLFPTLMGVVNRFPRLRALLRDWVESATAPSPSGADLDGLERLLSAQISPDFPSPKCAFIQCCAHRERESTQVRRLRDVLEGRGIRVEWETPQSFLAGPPSTSGVLCLGDSGQYMPWLVRTLMSRRVPVLALSSKRVRAVEWSQLNQEDCFQGVSWPTLDDVRFMAFGASGLLIDDSLQADRAVDFVVGRLAPVFTQEADAVLSSMFGRRFTSLSAQRTLFVDVSDIARMDLKTGIQRVVRRITEELLRNPPSGWRVEPVYERAGRYYLARQYTHGLLGLSLPESNWRPDVEARPASGDRFLGLDWAQPMVRRARGTLGRWKAVGVQRFFVVYDLLPLQIPQYFPKEFQGEMEVWLEDIATVGEGLLCISRTVAQEVEEWLSRRPDSLNLERPWVRHFPLGADPGGVSEAPAPLPQLAISDNSPLTILMVGTLDGRKGYQQVLQGFERLWRNGEDIRLVIVGRAGAQMGGLARDLREHSEGRGSAARLYWLEHVSDAQLAWLYQVCDALLCASEGEGYGLPLIEAARQGLPMIVRDLPVLREVAGEGALYFSGTAPESIEKAVLRWLALRGGSEVPVPSPPGLVSWEESAKALWRTLSRD